MSGYTYFIQGVDGGPIKIGMTGNHPTRRLRELQAGSPVKLRVLTVLIGSEHEAEFHAAFALGRLHGEWFNDTRELRRAVIQAAKAQRHTRAMRAYKTPAFWTEVDRWEHALGEDEEPMELWPEAKLALWDAAIAHDATSDYPLALNHLARLV